MFKLGRIVCRVEVASRTARDNEFARFVLHSLARHLTGDWGDLSEEDKAENEKAVKSDRRILSAYEHETYPKIWIITEADRSSTCILFAEER